MRTLPSPDDELLIARVAAAILRELGHVEAAPEGPEPEFMTDADIRRKVIPVSRSKWYYLMAQPDFPPAIKVGNTNFRNVAQARAFMASRQAV